MPKVSVVLPCYNAEKYLKEAIESILKQTFTDFELIIIDDGSTDRSAEIIHSFSDDRIRYVKNETNKGIVYTLNKGLDLSTGIYIARMDADDISLPDRFSEQVPFMDTHSDVGMCGGWVDFFTCPERQNDGKHPFEITYFSLLKGWCINHPTVMFRKSVLDEYHLRYNNCMAEDYDLWCRLIKHTRIVNLQKNLLKYRWHENNLSTHKENEIQKDVSKIRQNMLDFLTLNKGLQQEISTLLQRPEKKRIPVFLSADENYAPMVATTVLSAMKYTSMPVDFYVLDAGITPESKHKIIKSMRKIKNCTIEFIDIDMSLFDDFTAPEAYLNKSSYVRLLIPQIKPYLDRVIFSDVDVIFTGDIAQIYNENLDDKIIGVVPDVYYQMNPNGNDISTRLELPQEHQYFYAGLILMDCDKWRNNNITEKIFALSQKFGTRIQQADQDLLNIYFSNNYKVLSPKYEVTNLYLMFLKKLDKSIQKEIETPVIRHYESAYKPWNSSVFYEEKMRDFKLWWKWAKKTPFYKDLYQNFKKNQKGSRSDKV